MCGSKHLWTLFLKIYSSLKDPQALYKIIVDLSSNNLWNYPSEHQNMRKTLFLKLLLT